MSTEPQPGQSLTQRGESLPDATVPERAGAIVAEVVTSIAEEAQARAQDLHETAEKEAKAERDAAHEASAGVRRRLEALGGQLSSLRSGMRQEADVLSAGLRRLEAAPAVPALGSPAETRVQHVEEVTDVEVVEEDSIEPAGELPAEGEPAPAPEAGPDAAPEQGDDVRVRIARMSDRELARTYVDAVGASEERAAAGTDPGHAGDVARAIVDEARTRRSFTEPEEPRHGLRGRLGAIAGRGEGGPIDALREAVQQAQQ